ncbi:MAG: hypothetical protein U0V75_11590 [Ferruginibacter sp.]
MLNKMLLPNRYKRIGWLLLIPSTIFGILLIYTGFEGCQLKATVFAVFSDEVFGSSKTLHFIQTNITNTLAGVFFIAGALMVSFSKEKNEDEYIAEIRLSSLLWAVFISYVLLLLGFIFVYGTPFLSVMLYNMFTILVIFIARFNYLLYRNAKSAADEK